MMNKYHQSLVLLATKFRTNNHKLPFHFGICTRHLSEISTKSAYNEQNEKSSACPVTGRSRNPALTKVPSLPLLGTLFHLYSGTPKISAFDKYNYHAELRKRFGDFYTIGFPNFGTGSHGTVHITTDPEEMAKMVRNEGAYPSGSVQNLWMVRKVHKDTNSPLVQGDDYGLFGSGARWKTHRKFLGTGMLDPRAVKRFVPGLQKAAQLASQGAPARKKDLSLYLSHCAFDMFNTFMFGELTRCSDPNAFHEEENLENIQFCYAAIKFMNLLGEFQRNPLHKFMVETLGIKTKKYKEFENTYNVIDKIAMKKIQTFMERYERGDLSDMEKASYLAGAIERQAASDSEVSKEEMIALCKSSLLASVDTTSAVTSWFLVNLALNPSVQEKLFTELQTKSSSNGGCLTENISERSSFPYLHSCARESLRITPISPFSVVKKNTHSDIVFHGITFPLGTTFALDNIVGDVRYFSDADQFKPERWFADAVEARKGTSCEIMDHPFFRDSFGQGARRCPGSRVASVEVLCIVSQLVLDYKIEAKEKSLSEIQNVSRPLVQPLNVELDFIPR